MLYTRLNTGYGRTDERLSVCKGNAKRLAAGLPDGQMGNSEVGHMNMGAGCIVYQELIRITKEIPEMKISSRTKYFLQQ